MKDFDIAKYLREHQLGSYGILNHYVDLKPLKEGETEIPYTGPKDKLTGNGEGDKFDQAQIVSEDDSVDTNMFYVISQLVGMGLSPDQISQIPYYLNLYDEYIISQIPEKPRSEEDPTSEMEEEWDPTQTTDLKKFIGRLPKSHRSEEPSDTPAAKIQAMIDSGEITIQDIEAYMASLDNPLE